MQCKKPHEGDCLSSVKSRLLFIDVIDVCYQKNIILGFFIWSRDRNLHWEGNYKVTSEEHHLLVSIKLDFIFLNKIQCEVFITMSILKKALRGGYSLLVKNSPVLASKIIYYRTLGKRLNLKNPVTFNEKLMWLKLFEDDSLKIRCTDKYLVRNYISQKGYSRLLIDLYEVYENVDQINFDKLPNRFVMKCTHASGFNIICLDKEKLDKKQTLSKFKKWMETDYSLIKCEPHYSNIKPRIIVEKFLDEGFNNNLPLDYMIHCFHGEPHFIEIGLDYENTDKKYALLTKGWELLPFLQGGARGK